MIAEGFCCICLMMAVALVVFYALFGHYQLLPLGIVLAVMIIWAHRSNIGRLMRGEESKFVLKK
jgi:glycerol-3-phosphate acyltransferase PlsY